MSESAVGDQAGSSEKSVAADGAPSDIALPVLPTAVKLVQAGEYAGLMLETPLTSTLCFLDRGQCVHLGAELLKLAEKLPRTDPGLAVVQHRLTTP